MQLSLLPELDQVTPTTSDKRICKVCGTEKVKRKKEERWDCPKCESLRGIKSRKEQKTRNGGRNNRNQKDFERKSKWIKENGSECNKCGFKFNGRHVGVFEFHHMDPELKSFEIAASHLRSTPEEEVQKEIEKCIMLCNNCHTAEHDDLNIGVVSKEESIRILSDLKARKRKQTSDSSAKKNSVLISFNILLQTWYKKIGQRIFGLGRLQGDVAH